MKVLKIIKTTEKNGKNGKFLTINSKVLFKGNEEYCNIISYIGPISSGFEMDDSLVQVGEWKGKPSYSAFVHPEKKGEPQKYSPAPEPAPKIETKQYLPEELENLMTKCLEYFGRQKELLESFGVPKESVTFIVGSLFNSMKERGIRPNDWTVIKSEPAIDLDNGFANPDELERNRMLEEIKIWVKANKVTESTLSATRKLVMKRSETLDHATVEELKEIYTKVKPAGDF